MAVHFATGLTALLVEALHNPGDIFITSPLGTAQPTAAWERGQVCCYRLGTAYTKRCFR